MITIIPYFSPTGRTQQAADALTSEWECERLWVDMSEHDYDPRAVMLPGDGLCLLAVPCHYGRVPEFLEERIAGLRGHGRDAVLLVTHGGDDVGDTLTELRELAERAGFFVRAAVSAVVQHALCPDLEAGRPDTRDRHELTQFGQLIWDIPRLPMDTLELPGNEQPYRMRPANSRVPEADIRCDECGACYPACPTHAISAEQLPHVYSDQCIACMQCAAVCPRDARHLSDLDAARVRQGLHERGAFASGRQKNTLYMRRLGAIQEQ